MATVKSIKRRLQAAKVAVKYHKDAKSETWYPFSSIQGIVGEVKEVVNTLTADQIRTARLQKFVDNAPRLSALLIHVNRISWLQLFCDADFDDSLFPIKIERDASEKQMVVSIDAHHQNVVVLPDEEDETSVDSFADLFQWQFFVPIFSHTKPTYEFHYNQNLPFLKEFDVIERSNYSTVTRRVIHRKHLDFPMSPDDDQIGTVVDNDEDRNPLVAVKELISAKFVKPEDFERLAEKEAAILTRFQEQDHPHFIKVIARYTQGNRHFFVFPWAKGGDLRNFWDKQPSLSIASLNYSSQDWVEYITWFFEQLLGLASAIKNLHHVPDNPGASCRHGDLKPENILCFCKEIPGPGKIPRGVRLVVADAGHAKVHEKATQLRGEKTTTQGGTLAYAPPEVDLQEDKPRTRRYDIWSLGCLYLEFLIWILHGKNALQDFRNNVGSQSPFWEKANGELKAIVRFWINTIKEDPRCTSNPPTAIGRLIDLIQERLLIPNVGHDDPRDQQPMQDEDETPKSPVDILVRKATIDRSTTPVERAPAEEMLEEMEKIFDAAKREGPNSISWIHWDGMAAAAKRGLPKAPLNLTLRVPTGRKLGTKEIPVASDLISTVEVIPTRVLAKI